MPRQRGRAPVVDERPGRAHRHEGTGADAQQRDAELAVVDAGVRLHGGQRRAPGAPEGAEGGEAAQHTHPPGHPSHPRGAAQPRGRRSDASTRVTALCRPRLHGTAAFDYFLASTGSRARAPTQAQGRDRRPELLVGRDAARSRRRGGGGRRQGRDPRPALHRATSKASPQLLLACATGQHFKSAVLTGAQGRQGPAGLPDVLAPGRAGQRPTRSGSVDVRGPLDSVSLNFADRGRVQEQKADGSPRRPPGPAGTSRRTRSSDARARVAYDAVPYPGIRSRRRILTVSRRWRRCSA